MPCTQNGLDLRPTFGDGKSYRISLNCHFLIYDILPDVSGLVSIKQLGHIVSLQYTLASKVSLIKDCCSWKMLLNIQSKLSIWWWDRSSVKKTHRLETENLYLGFSSTIFLVLWAWAISLTYLSLTFCFREWHNIHSHLMH